MTDEDYGDTDASWESLIAGLQSQARGEVHQRRRERDKELIEKIRERSEDDIRANYENARIKIVDEYIESNTSTHPSEDDTRHQIKRMSDSAELTRQLETKAASFQAVYASTVFRTVIHAAQEDLGEDVVLKSPAALARERGVTIDDIATSSGVNDSQLGNTEYVFANSAALRSRSVLGRQYYKIDSEDGYVVPVDIADFSVPIESPVRYKGDQAAYSEERDQFADELDHMVLQLYSENIYTIKDFQRVFSLFSASFFDNPQQAISFFQRYREEVHAGALWSREVGLVSKTKTEQDRDIAMRMQAFYEKTGITPPFIPEFQYKDSVSARKLPEQEIDLIISTSNFVV